MDTATRNGMLHPSPACPRQSPAIRLISITRFDSEDATRLALNPEHVSRLEADMRRRLRECPSEHPVTTPLRVIERDDRFPIVAGNHRYAAALRLPLLDLPAIVLSANLTPIQFFIEAHRDNALREDYNRVEMARNILHVRDQLGCSQAEAGRLLGIENPSDVTKLLSVLKGIPEDLLDKIGEGDGKLPFTSAYKLTMLRDESRIRELAEKAIKGLLCRDRLVDVVDGIAQCNRREKKPKLLKVRLDGVQMVASNPTLEGLQAFAERLLGALRKLAKEGDSIEFLPARLKAL